MKSYSNKIYLSLPDTFLKSLVEISKSEIGTADKLK